MHDSDHLTVKMPPSPKMKFSLHVATSKTAGALSELESAASLSKNPEERTAFLINAKRHLRQATIQVNLLIASEGE